MKSIGSAYRLVSNSSWANEGYLAVLKMAEDEELLFEDDVDAEDYARKKGIIV